MQCHLCNIDHFPSFLPPPQSPWSYHPPPPGKLSMGLVRRIFSRWNFPGVQTLAISRKVGRRHRGRGWRLEPEPTHPSVLWEVVLGPSPKVPGNMISFPLPPRRQIGAPEHPGPRDVHLCPPRGGGWVGRQPRPALASPDWVYLVIRPPREAGLAVQGGGGESSAFPRFFFDAYFQLISKFQLDQRCNPPPPKG